MLNKLKRTIKHSVIYSLGNLSSKLVGLILLPLYTEYLTTSEYGMLALLEVTSQVLILLLGLNLSTAMLRWCSAEKDEDRKRSIIFTISISTVIISAVSLFFLLPFVDFFSVLFFDHARYSNYFTILFFSIAFGILNLLPLSLIRVQEKSSFFVVVTTLKFTVILLLNIYFVAYLKLGVEGVILGQLIGQILFTIVTLPFMIKNSSAIFDLVTLKHMISYSFPLVFSSMFAMLLSVGDRYILKILSTLSDVGIYSLGYKVAGFINVFIIHSFQLGFLPLAFKYAEQSDSKRFFSKIQTYFTLLLVLSALTLSIFSLEIIEVFTSDESYISAYLIIPFISFAFILKGMEYVFSLAFHQMKITRYNAAIVITSALVNIGLNFLLIPIYGVFGAAISMIIAYLLMSLLSFYFAQKVYFVPYEKMKILLLLFLFIIIVVSVFLFVNELPIALRVGIKLFILIIFPFILLPLRFYEEIELLRIKQSWVKWRNPKRWRDNFKQIKP
ncbi:MAG TPA: hypothetical protein ENN33_00580 [Ignavibacteria bacterium]|nr:hypothetical protein [Ignavibacteria bacterium]